MEKIGPDKRFGDHVTMGVLRDRYESEVEADRIASQLIREMAHASRWEDIREAGKALAQVRLLSLSIEAVAPDWRHSGACATESSGATNGRNDAVAGLARDFVGSGRQYVAIADVQREVKAKAVAEIEDLRAQLYRQAMEEQKG